MGRAVGGSARGTDRLRAGEGHRDYRIQSGAVPRRIEGHAAGFGNGAKEIAVQTALITGITGQDGSYLAELLLSKGYRVVGMARRASTVTYERIQHMLDDIVVMQGDLTDQGSLLSMFEKYEPTEVYNLAAQSFVPTSWNQPALTGDVTALGVTRMLEADPICEFEDQVLPGLVQRDVWEGCGGTTEGIDAFLSPEPVRCGESVWALDHGQLSGVIRTVSPSQEFSSITKVPAGVWNSLRARSPTAWRESSWVWPRNCGWAISRRGGTGDLPATTCSAMWMMLQQDQADNFVVGSGETHSVQGVLRGRLRARGPGLQGLRRPRPDILPAGRGGSAGGRSRAKRAPC